MFNLNNITSKIKTTIITNNITAEQIADAVEKSGMKFTKSKKVATANFQNFINNKSDDMKFAYAIANNTKGLSLNKGLEEARKVISSLTNAWKNKERGNHYDKRTNQKSNRWKIWRN